MRATPTASSSTAKRSTYPGGALLFLCTLDASQGASQIDARRDDPRDRMKTGKRGEGMGEHDTGASAFETIRHTDGEGGEWWSARELMGALTYTNWRNFSAIVQAAIVACEASNYAPSEHFDRSIKMVPLGSGAHRELEDWRLSRYACYLVVMNADANKPVVALGQSYFAVQTRRMELADAASADALAGLDEAQRRLLTREQLARQNATLASAASGAGVVSSRDFAIFQDHGYAGLYNGERARDIAARKGLKRGERILDFMGSEELAANLFRATQAQAKITREGITGRDAANKAHHDVGRIVRRVIIDELQGTPPELLPTPSEGIGELQKRERRAVERERQPSLFDALDAPEDGEGIGARTPPRDDRKD
jgi:DNA-damage-inducible protein D